MKIKHILLIGAGILAYKFYLLALLLSIIYFLVSFILVFDCAEKGRGKFRREVLESLPEIVKFFSLISYLILFVKENKEKIFAFLDKKIL